MSERGSAASAVPSTAPARDVAGIAIDWLFDSPTVRLTRWSCLVRKGGVTSERQQFWHVIGFPHAGSYRLHADGESVLIDVSGVAFFNPLGVYRTSHPHGFGDRGVGIVVRPDVTADALADAGLSAGAEEARFPFLHGPSSPRAYWIQHAIFARAIAGDPVDPIEIEEGALALVAETVGAAARRSKTARPAERPSSARRRREAVDAARGYLLRRYREPVRLAEVAASAGLSPFHTCRSFKRETGLSVNRFVHRLRLRAALDLLPEYRRDITRLALDLGYSSHSHFTYAFRREFGFPPSSAWTRPPAIRPSLPN
ncbi:MAG TPA: AraC family transcriptional regulator [Thermoanaerobaculia bacterium]|nr:AraC family transcriptional regulator [Thermoanaerobaculia bacterium]